MRLQASLRPIFFGVLLIALVGAPNWFGGAESAVAGVIEAPLLLLGTWLAVRATRDAYMDSSVRSKQFAVACALVVLFLVGQMAKSKKAYPFLPMRMYGGEAQGDAEFLVYEAKLSDGSTTKLRLGSAVPELGTARMARNLERRLLKLHDVAPGEQRALRPEQAEGIKMLRWLMRQENKVHMGEQRSGNERVVIREVLVYRITLRPPYTAAQRERTLLMRVSLQGS